MFCSFLCMLTTHTTYILSQAYKGHQSCPGCRLSCALQGQGSHWSPNGLPEQTAPPSCPATVEMKLCLVSAAFCLFPPSLGLWLSLSLHIFPFSFPFSLHSPLEAFGVHCWLEYSVLVNGLNGKVKGQSEVLCSCNWEGSCTWAMLSNSHTYTHAHTELLYQRSSDEFLS